MARRHKFTAEEWRKIFKLVAHYCSKHKDDYGGGIEGFRKCMSEKLRKAYELGKLPEEVAREVGA